ncbi:MAG: hypothetical protein C0621_04610 [Desulfuromonas sp.]|nr:MAG: hypothetical protein C0621_04610 [Desulfuromonas sp.]
MVVSELLDVVEQGFVATDGTSPRQQLLRQHRLQPFSPGYFTPDSSLFSFAAAAHQGAVAANAPRHDLPPLLASPLSPAGETELSVERLRRFFAHPCKAFIQERLGVTLAKGEEGVSEREVLTLDGLGRYQLADTLLQAALRNEEPSVWQEFLAAEGRLPVGAPGHIAFDTLWRQSTKLAATIHPHLAAPRGLAIDLTLTGIRLRGEISLQGESGPLLYRNGSLRRKDLLDSWIVHLLVNCVTAPTASRLFGRETSILFPPVSGACARLEELVGFWQQGNSAPLPFIPSASSLYVETLNKGKVADEALERVRNAWNDSWSSYGAEMNDPWLNLCGGETLLDSAQFAPLAEAIFTPLFATQEEG